MLVKEWMAKSPLVIEENTSIIKATQLMKENKIRRIPVVKDGRLVGIVTDRDLKDATPSKTTTLDMHELYYLLSEIKVKDIMTSNPITLRETDSVERAAAIMLKDKISGLPVANDDNEVVGIITQTDILKVMISISGIYHSPIQIAVELEDKSGALHELLVAMREEGARIVSVLTSKENVPEGFREVYIRIQDMKDNEIDRLKDNIGKKYKILYLIKEDMSEVPKA